LNRWGAWSEPIRIHDYVDDDLFAAIALIRADETDPRYRGFFAAILNDIFAAEEAERSREIGQDRDRIGHTFLYGFVSIFAKYHLHQNVEGEAADLLALVVNGIARAPEIAASLLQEIVVAELNRSAGERFWYIWSRCAEAAYTKAEGVKSPHVVGYIEGRTLLRTVVFAQTPWSKAVKTWDELENHRDFVHEAFRRVGSDPRGFAALLRLLRTVGEFLLPDAVLDLDEACRKSNGANLLDEESKYDLEMLLRDCVLSHGTVVRNRDALRRAILRLLDLLVDQGSSLAFQLRELIISPMSSS
jgi:hypothetical protein